MTFAHVAVPVPARAGSLFTYAVPRTMAVSVGSIVMAPFSSRVLPGIVVEVDDATPTVPTRELLARVPDAPSLLAERVKVASWIARHYRSTVFDALNLFLPPGWRRAVVRSPSANDGIEGWAFQWPHPPLSEDSEVALASHLAASQAPRGDESPPKQPRAGTARSNVIALLEAVGPARAGTLARDAGCTLSTVGRMVAEGLLVMRVDSPHDLSPPTPNPQPQRSTLPRPPPTTPSGVFWGRILTKPSFCMG